MSDWFKSAWPVLLFTAALVAGIASCLYADRHPFCGLCTYLGGCP